MTFYVGIGVGGSAFFLLTIAFEWLLARKRRAARWPVLNRDKFLQHWK